MREDLGAICLVHMHEHTLNTRAGYDSNRHSNKIGNFFVGTSKIGSGIVTDSNPLLITKIPGN